jgi:predicted Zn-ribbon and HTH transcriptional regulator
MSQYNSGMQKLLCIYFKAKGVPKSVYHMFQSCGVVLSFEWSVSALTNISNAAMEKAIAVFEAQPCLIIYDNIRLPFPVKHQRGDSLTTTDNGTAITMMPLRDSMRARELLHNSTLWEQNRIRISTLYRQGRMSHLSDVDLFNMPGFLQERRRTICNILGFLFDIPQISDSTKRNHEILAILPAVCQLPFGQEHRNRQYMLHTVCQEEASYEGNYALTLEILRQLGLSTQEAQEAWAVLRCVPLIGDSLTIARLRMLIRMKAEDFSNLQRLGHFILAFGWFHLDMNLVNTIFYHHYGESLSSGLARDAAASHRSGLKKPTKKQGPQYHTAHEFMQHTTTARLRGLWLWVSETKTVAELAEWVSKSSEQDIYNAAEKIWLNRASARALQTHKADPNLCNSISLNRDLLLRHEVLISTKTGDVGRMENTLPLLLYFFSGAGCKNYAREIAETLHWMRYEAPPGVA